MITINSTIFYFSIYYFICHFILDLRSLLCLPCHNPSISAVYHKNLKYSLIIMPIIVIITVFSAFFVHKIQFKIMILLIFIGFITGLGNYHITTAIKGSYLHSFFVYNVLTVSCFIVFFNIY